MTNFNPGDIVRHIDGTTGVIEDEGSVREHGGEKTWLVNYDDGRTEIEPGWKLAPCDDVEAVLQGMGVPDNQLVEAHRAADRLSEAGTIDPVEAANTMGKIWGEDQRKALKADPAAAVDVATYEAARARRAPIYTDPGIGGVNPDSSFSASMLSERSPDDGESIVIMRTEWAVFTGGATPDDAAMMRTFESENAARRELQWVAGGTLATRQVIELPWIVAAPATLPQAVAAALEGDQ